MTLTVTYSDEDTIALPAWLMKTLGLQVGQPIETIASHHFLYFTSPTQNGHLHNGVQNGSTLTESEEDEDEQSLEALIAEIKAIPPNPSLVTLPTKSGAELLAELDASPPSSELFSFDEWQVLWKKFEEEEDALEIAHEIAEGLR